MKRALILTLALAACVGVAAGKLGQAEVEACAAKGGRVGIAGLSGDEMCVLPAPDAGKACGKASDCAAWCDAETRSCAPELYPLAAGPT
ncbi:MAG: hypothetical protein R3D63_11325 [Paracoccaceae bacterium]